MADIENFVVGMAGDMPFFVNGEQIYDKEVAEFSNILVFAAFGLEFFIITFFFQDVYLKVSLVLLEFPYFYAKHYC